MSHGALGSGLLRFLARIALAPLMVFCFFLRLLPRRFFLLLGGALGSLLLSLGFRKKVVLTNLKLALGNEQSPAELAELLKKIYRNVGITFLEIARNFALGKRQIERELVLRESDRARLAEVMSRGKGAVFVSAHIANWELLAMGMAAHGYPVAAVVKKMNNLVSQVLIERQRTRTGLEIIYSGGTLEKMKQALSRGIFIGFMVDQNTTGKKGIRANFFNVPASSIRGLAGLAKETGTAVIPICAFRLPDGTHQVEFLPELEYLRAKELPEGSEERYLREEWLNTQQYQAAVESLIRIHPEQWLWIHRRWKANREPLSFATAHRENRREEGAKAQR